MNKTTSRIAIWAITVHGIAACQLADDGLDGPHVQSLGVNGCPQIAIEATRRFSPDEWLAAEIPLQPFATIAIPNELPVTVGNAGNHWAKLELQQRSGTVTTCCYQGRSNVSRPTTQSELALGQAYGFRFCFAGTGSCPVTTATPNATLTEGQTLAVTHARLVVEGGVSSLGPVSARLATATTSCGCSSDSSCDDNNSCNGLETCNAESGICSPGLPPADGTVCGVGLLCQASACVGARCGDGYLTSPELCDDGNNADGDGCFQCRPGPLRCRKLVEQTDCPRSDACDIAGKSARFPFACRDAGQKRVGDSCQRSTDCVRGATCLGERDRDEFLCRRFCDDGSDCPRGTACMRAAAVQAKACTLACNPVNGRECPRNWTCLATDAETSGPYTTCILPNVRARQEGRACDSSSDCALGLACPTDPRGRGTACRKQCNVRSGAGCESLRGKSCRSYQTRLVIGGVEYGYCE